MHLSSKCYSSVILSDSKVTFFEEWEDAAYCLFFFCFLETELFKGRCI